SWTEVIPPLLWPALALSCANLVALVPRPAAIRDLPIGMRTAITTVGLGLMTGGVVWSGWTLAPYSPSNWLAAAGVLVCWIGLPANPFARERQGFLLFALGGSIFLYLVAPAIGFPDIRFVPIGQMFLGLLAADFLAWAGSALRFRTLYAAIVVLACIGWSWAHLGYLPSWLTWNYAGYERKATWPTFEAINDHLRGDVNDPRVVFEHSQIHNRFGSSRAFENLPLFSGRSTLEGVFHQVSPNSAHVFYIQSQTSEKTSGPFPQHTYIRLDPSGAVPRLRLFNVSDLVVVSEKAKAAYEAAPEFEKTFSAANYEVYHLDSAATGYVVAAENQPVLYDGPDHKLAFYRWFKHSELLDIPVVAAKHMSAERRAEFDYRTDAIERLPRIPYENPCQVDSQIEQYRVTFQTTCPGRPHIIKVSYFPRWMARDGSPVDFIAPGFMMVWPAEKEFELYYGRTSFDLFAMSLSLFGLLFAAACWVRPQLARRTVHVADFVFGPALGTIGRYPVLVGTGLLIALAGAGISTRYDLTEPNRAFRQGQEAYRERDFQRAIETYGEWTQTDRDTFKHATAMFQLGVSYAEADQPAAAIETLERLQFQFPNINYGAGTLFHLARSYAALEMEEKAQKTADVLFAEHSNTAWTKRLQREYPRLTPPSVDEPGKTDAPSPSPALKGKADDPKK
ncbi:MAG: tetratricopeptide (TPR) repeat protein, partial [Hyphomicrobiaceae bacterium]